jgi:hypothetical protein
MSKNGGVVMLPWVIRETTLVGIGGLVVYLNTSVWTLSPK